MQVAAILTDLTSLRACDPNAALALVSARPEDAQKKPTDRMQTEDGDQDLKRARDLLELHATVKVAHQGGPDQELIDARNDVARVLREL